PRAPPPASPRLRARSRRQAACSGAASSRRRAAFFRSPRRRGRSGSGSSGAGFRAAWCTARSSPRWLRPTRRFARCSWRALVWALCPICWRYSPRSGISTASSGEGSRGYSQAPRSQRSGWPASQKRCNRRPYSPTDRCACRFRESSRSCKAASEMAATGAERCFHCGEPAPAGARYSAVTDGAARIMCCAGCAAVARTIAGHGLTAYYASREGTARRAAPQKPGSDYAAYDLAEVQRPFVCDAGTGAKQATLLAEGVTCGACAWLIERGVQRLAGVRSVAVNVAAHRVQVEWDDSRTHLSAILE